MILYLEDVKAKVYYLISCQNPDTKNIYYIKNMNINEKSIDDLLQGVNWTTTIEEAAHFNPDDFDLIKKYLGGDYDLKLLRRISLDFDDTYENSCIDDNMKLSDRIDISKVEKEPELIKSWDDLMLVGDSHTHKIRNKKR